MDYPSGLWVYTPLYDRATYERTGPREASVVNVGLDVHKDSIVIAVAREGREAAENWKTIPNDAVRLRKALKCLLRTGERLKVCYEAGPTGFVLCRRLREAGMECLVVAPSLVPGKPGDRGKMDRRDARRLAHFLRSGDLTEVTGKRRRQGPITRCGNGHLRRFLVEAAWHYRHVPLLSKELRRRNQRLAPGVQRIAWEAQKRLNKRLYHLLHSGKSVQKAITALARELAGFLWAVGQEEQLLAAS